MEYQICKKCILDTNIPGLHFNEDGICNICVEYESRKKQDPAINKDYATLEKEFGKLIRADDKKYNYDCLCLYSGGKDSTYMLYNLVKKYRLRVFAFTLDNWFLSKQTYLNIEKVLSSLNVDHTFFKPSWEVTAAFFKAGIFDAENSIAAKKMAFLIGHVCWPCFVMISVFSIKTALEKKIPNIVVGTTPGQLRQKESNLLSKYSGIVDVYKNLVLPFLKIIPHEYSKVLDFSFSDKLKSMRLKLAPFYEYHNYNEDRILEVVKSTMGWQRPSDTDSCSSNCLINALGISIHRKKYNISPYLIPLAHDVRIGLIDRKKACEDASGDIDKKMAQDMAIKLNIDPKIIL